MKLSELKCAVPGRAVLHKQLTTDHPDRAVRINRFLPGGNFLDTDGNIWNGEVEGWCIVDEQPRSPSTMYGTDLSTAFDLGYPSGRPTETIVAAAVQIEGVTFSLPQPARHGQVLDCIKYLVPEEMVGCQGFLTSTGRFVNRVQAKHIAHRAGQPIIRDNPHPRAAFSEDFW